jgi:DNA-binding HxlR family transcriptional regulator
MKGYGQFCSIAMAAQILGRRWTLLVLRELLLGARHFNDIKRGVPLMSPALLSQRLKELQDAGIIVYAHRAGRGSEYRLTEAGKELAPLLDVAARWGRRWARTRLTADQLDPGLLMWYVRRLLDPAQLPARRTVIYVEFSDVAPKKSRWWLVVNPKAVELCIDDPGFDIDVYVSTDVRTLTETFVGDMLLTRALRSGAIRVTGTAALVRSFERWWPKSPYAWVPRAGANGAGTSARRLRTM